MSANDAACEHRNVSSQQNWTDDGKGGTKRDGFVAHCDDCGVRFVPFAHVRSAGAAPLDVERVGQALALAWLDSYDAQGHSLPPDLARHLDARLAEGTDR